MALLSVKWYLFLVLTSTRSTLSLRLPTIEAEPPTGKSAETGLLPSTSSSINKKVIPAPPFPIQDEDLPEEYDNDDDYSDSSALLIHLVKNKDLKSWLESQGPDAYLTRSSSVLYLRHRVRRQAAAAPGAPPGDDNPHYGKTVTPVLPINGVKKYNDTDCMPWPEVAAIIRSHLLPKFKRHYIDPASCNMKSGLECLPIEERGATVYRCRCQLVYGPKAVYTNYTDITGRIRQGCFIPAGLGWDSECYAKSYNNFGYPLPFGDPAGTNAEAAVQQDAYNKPDGEQIVVDYIRWNSILPECVHHAECRERGTYRGQRCQCTKGHKLIKPEGKCSGAEKVNQLISLLALVLMKGLLY